MGCDDYVAHATRFIFTCPDGHMRSIAREVEWAKQETPDAPVCKDDEKQMSLVGTEKAW